MKDLQHALLAAHAAGQTAELVRLYQIAADTVTEDAGAVGFYLTHAYVFALEMDHPDAAGLRDRLIAMGRDTALQPPAPPLR